MKRAVIIVLLALAACDSGSDVPAVRHEPIVVYASNADQTYLPKLFSGFTDETHIPVTVRYGESAQLADDVISDRGAPPADVLLTTTIADIWRAADEGALRPLVSENLLHVPDFLRDPDEFWVATGLNVAVILHTEESAANAPRAYADLADKKYRGRLCMGSSSLQVNRSLLAMMIAELDIRPTELIVRGWVRNLALPPFETDQDVFDAVNSGRCDFGIVSSETAAIGTSRHGDGTLNYFTPQPAYADAEGIGVARHARSPGSAQRLVDWILSANVQRQHTRAAHRHSARDDQLQQDIAERITRANIGLVGWHGNDAVLLAERAHYR